MGNANVLGSSVAEAFTTASVNEDNLAGKYSILGSKRQSLDSNVGESEHVGNNERVGLGWVRQKIVVGSTVMRGYFHPHEAFIHIAASETVLV